MQQRRKRNQNGCGNSKQIALRMPQHEMQRHEQICAEKKMTRATLAYLAYKAGLPLVIKNQSNPAASLNTGRPQGSDTLPDAGTSFYSHALKTA